MNRATRFYSSVRWSSRLDKRYSASEIARLDPFDTSRRHVRPSLGQRSIHVDRTTSILHDIGRKAGMARIDCCPGNTEVSGKSRDKDRVDIAFLEIARQPGMGLSVSLHE